MQLKKYLTLTGISSEILVTGDKLWWEMCLELKS